MGRRLLSNSYREHQVDLMGYFQILRRIAQNNDTTSFASSFRRKRWAIFQDIVESLPRPIKILDVGGTTNYWANHHLLDESGIEITIINHEPQSYRPNNISFVMGDARNMKNFKDNEFDIVFSNSVIEHVGTFEHQKKMADEIIRVGKRYFIQTPNYFFPIEPHFLIPFFQFLPMSIRAWLVSHYKLGWHKKATDISSAHAIVSQISLLRKKELMILFPDAKLVREKIMGLTKSFMVIR